jgi:hypothetical protein
MQKKSALKFNKDKDSSENIEIFFKYLKGMDKPYSTILLNAFKKDLNEDEFRQKIREDIIAHLEKYVKS